MTLKLFLLIAGLICFILSAIGVGGKVNLQSLGLACVTGAFLFN